ncbi:hypothetical protein AGMMS49942_25880 [Spirochaetia bacterium]|nr:hypothetical protein AGMMS49942_25880 [Spirochaetia bacterium]
MKANDLEQFLKEYKAFKKIEHNKNFFEISGFPHYENVFSNVLSYFLTNNLILKCLLDCINTKFNTLDDAVCDVRREEYTDSGKRIDIVIETNDYIIGIENKINAPLYNDLDDYYNYLKKLSENLNKRPVCIILSKNKVLNISENWRNVVQKEFCNNIRNHYSELIGQLEYRYFLFLNEFVENIAYLQGASEMNNEFLKLAKIDDNAEKIENIISNGMDLRNELIQITNRIIGDLNDDENFTKKCVYNNIGDIGYFCSIAVLQNCFISEKKFNFTFDISVDINGFEISIFERNEKEDQDFWEILELIIHDFKNDFTVEKRAFYNKNISLNDYETVITLAKKWLKNFDDYIKSKDNIY